MYRRWIPALLLTSALCAALLVAWNGRQSLEHARAESSMLETRVRSLRARQSALEAMEARCRDLNALIARAGTAGLDPARWMVTPLELDTTDDLTRLKASDTQLRSLLAEKNDLSRRFSGRQADASRMKAEIERLDMAIASRQRELEQEARFTPAALEALLRTLSTRTAKDATADCVAPGYWFVPESLTVTRLEQDPGGFAVQASGEFLMPR